jgi:hypothetical protein
MEAPRPSEALVPAILQGDTSQARSVLGLLFLCMSGGDRKTVVARLRGTSEIWVQIT